MFSLLRKKKKSTVIEDNCLKIRLMTSSFPEFL